MHTAQLHLLKLILPLFLCLPTYLFSGNAASGYLGPKARLGISVNPQLSFARAPGIQTKNAGIRGGFNGGLQFDYYFAPNYGLTSGLFFNFSSVKVQYSIGNDTTGYTPYTHTISNQALEIPIGIKFRSNEIDRFTIYGELGFSTLIPVSARANLEPDFDGVVALQQKAYNKIVNPVNLGIFLGMGFEYNISGSVSFVSGIVYKYYFINHIKDHKRFPSVGLNDDNIFLNNLALKIGFLF